MERRIRRKSFRKNRLKVQLIFWEMLWGNSRQRMLKTKKRKKTKYLN